MRRVLIALFLGASALVVLPAAPAAAAARVTLANPDGAAVVDPTYATTLRVGGIGFQSIQGGHGGVYVFFGTITGRWRPSQGGQTGADYLYVPDSESVDNQGFQRFIAFPGSDTAGSAQATMSKNGSWSTTITVPGATFEAVDRSGHATTVDCRVVTCGVITVGAHGVVNGANETFTPVRVQSLYDEAPASPPAPVASASDVGGTPPADAPAAPAAPAEPAEPAPPVVPGVAALDVDRASAHPGNVLAFSATGLPAGAQVSAVLDDGAAGAGPFLVGTDGALAGVVTIPVSAEAGTHELRLFGVEEPPSVSFAITDASTPTTATSEAVAATAATASASGEDRLPLLFAAASLGVLAIAGVRLLLARRGRRRA